MKPYNHTEIEKHWQKKWTESQLYKTPEKHSGKPKHYVLDMFPYPSGEGLHVGHPKGYIATDIYSRFKRMQGFEVLHPMGWDAFGLPAENYAIKNKIHPRVAVDKNIARYKEQLEKIGFDYDWSREINTTDPKYYKWTQWIFLELYKKGLAYESYAPINWCPSCQTGLANEDLENGTTCERCNSLVEQKLMRQWMLRITDYADRLVKDLSLLPKWPEHIKEQQRHWIGRKEGVTITHKVADTDITLESFSAYPAWLFADTFIVLAPEHPLISKLVDGLSTEKEVIAFVENITSQPSTKRREEKEKLGVFTGRYAQDPLSERLMPIWVANFALMNFGTGVVRCSAHDSRDLEFARKYEIPLRSVVRVESGDFVDAHKNTGTLEDSGPFTNREISPALEREMVEWMTSKGIAKRCVTYRLEDWVFSRQRYWGEPIPIIHCEKCGAVAVPEKDLPVTLPEVEHYEPSGTGESPLAKILSWVNVSCPRCSGDAKRETNTMPQWAGSSWYYLRFVDPQNAERLAGTEKEKYWLPVDLYVGGAEHATRHLIYSRFWHKFLYDQGIVTYLEPFSELHSVGLIMSEDGRKMSKRYGNVINPDDIVAQFGADTLRIYEMFMGPFENSIAWSTDGIVGARRFVERVWRMQEYIQDASVEVIEVILNKTIKKVSADIAGFKFNTAISQMMIFINAVEKVKNIGLEQYTDFIKLLAPFAPHITEELWNTLVCQAESLSIHTQTWPTFNPEKTEYQQVTIGVQVNGKVRGTIIVFPNTTHKEIIKQSKDSVSRWLDGKTLLKELYIEGKIVNLVTD